MENQTLGQRVRMAWNAFFNRDPTEDWRPLGPTSSYNPSRKRPTRGNERSIVNSIYNRIAMDVASLDIKHVDLDDEGRYLSTRNSKLNECLTLDANIDQTGRAFIQDVVYSMLDEGSVATLPMLASLLTTCIILPTVVIIKIV